jgi:hypothetical protein
MIIAVEDTGIYLAQNCLDQKKVWFVGVGIAEVRITGFRITEGPL